MIALLAGIGTQIAQIKIVAFVVMILSFWGMVVVFDANWWFSHNLRIVGNTQKYLFGGLFSTILPSEYLENTIRRDRIYSAHLWAISLIIAWVFISYIFTLSSVTFSTLDGIFYFLLNFISLILGIYLLRAIDSNDRKNIVWFFRRAPGITLLNSDQPTTIQVAVASEERQVIADENIAFFSTISASIIICISSLGQFLLANKGYNMHFTILTSLIWFAIPLLSIFVVWRRYSIGKNLRLTINAPTKDTATDRRVEQFRRIRQLDFLISLISVLLFFVICLPFVVQTILIWITQ
jgi:hypothetical protein